LVFPATDRDIARSVCERIVTAFQTTRHEIGPQPVSVTVSIGYATHGTGQRFPNMEALIKAADQALYTAKLQGRNRTVRYEAGERAPVVQFL
jgi:diguanylate cyclase (GGDEF)-like protein